MYELANRIKDALRNSPTIPDVNDTVRHFASDVLRMEKSGDKYEKALAIQIKNLAAYRRMIIREENRSGKEKQF